jgi:hypothetical protein
LTAACTDETASVDPAAAADRIVGELDLPADVTPCLTTEFGEDVAARRALDPDVSPSETELDALSDVVAACVPAATFAASVAPQMATGYRTVAEISSSQEHCLADEIAALSDDDRGLFVTGPVSRIRTPESERSLAVSDLLARLLAACKIDIGSAPEPSAGPTS